MPIEPKTLINWFDRDGRRYAQFRPEYPSALAAFLADLAPANGRALDVGCGTGQLTLQLAGHFREVIGIDPSGEQLSNAPVHDRVTWLCARAEAIPLPAASLDLITAAQAAHWFDLPAFYAEARRLAVPNAVIALASYGVLRLDGDALQDRFARFYRDEIGLFWPPERRLVDNGYADIAFPFDELPAPPLFIRRDWTLEAFLGYISTWSAARRALAAGQGNILLAFARDLSDEWGDAGRLRRVAWPVTLRAGRI